MTTPICNLCCDKDPFNDLNWDEIAADVFKSVQKELIQEEPVKSCPSSGQLLRNNRPIITGDDTEDEDSDIEDDRPEVDYYQGISSTIYSGAHQSKRTKSHLLEDIRKLYAINQVLLLRMSRLMNTLESEREHKHKLIESIQSKFQSVS